jgi:UDP-N-acetylmuramate dehydrogenase
LYFLAKRLSPLNNQSLSIQEHVSLKSHNTFGLNAKARYFCEPSNLEQLSECYAFAAKHSLKTMVLGGGSNVLFKSKTYEGLILKPLFTGIEITEEPEGYAIMVGANENWHQFVLHTVDRGMVGFENLSLIPGTVGACPVQNIGAYGVEVSDYITQVCCWDPETKQQVSFDNDACNFAYRDSIFKGSHANLIITHVEFWLPKTNALKLGYGDVRAEVIARAGLTEPVSTDQMGAITPAVVAQVIADIRSRKLPDPKDLGNAGSFFKNPIVSAEKYNQLIEVFPDIVAFPHGADYKLAAGWLIDQQGFKGQSYGNVAMHAKQALVMVNLTGQAESAEVFALAERIKARIAEVYGVQLEIEPVTVC